MFSDILYRDIDFWSSFYSSEIGYLKKKKKYDQIRYLNASRVEKY